MSESKKQLADPQRLSEEGGIMAALGGLRDQGLSAERLARGRDALSTRIAQAPSTTGAGAKASLGLGKAALVLAAGLLVGTWLAIRSPSDTQSQALDNADVAEQAVFLVATDAGLAAPLDATPMEVSLPADAAQAKRASAIKAERAEASSEASEPSSSNQLAEQLAILRSAKEHVRRAQYESARKELTDLHARFPRSPLRAESDLLSAVILSESGEYAAARSAIAKLVEDPLHAGRRAQLHRMMVDLNLQEGSCDQAQASLERAVMAKLGNDARLTAQRGIDRCRASRSTDEQK